jgi:hypothetical protein
MTHNEHFILIDSRLRDTSKYITPAQYVFDLETPLQNVTSVELVHAVYSKNDSNPEKYAYLCIKEIPIKRFLTTTRGYPFDDDYVFTYLPFYKQCKDTIEYEFTSNMFNTSYTFEQPLSSLSSLSVSIIDKDGRLFPVQEHIVCFKVHTQNDNIHSNIEHIDHQTNILINHKDRDEKVITPYDVLGLTRGLFSLDMLVERFKQRANTLRVSGQYSQAEYEELRQAFKTLAASFKKNTT